MSHKFITIHCAATQNLPSITADTIRKWHVGKGWKDIGYHFVIETDGAIKHGRPLNQTGAHVLGNNRDNIGICLVGGIDSEGKSEDNYTDAQMLSLELLVKGLMSSYDIEKVLGHRDWPGAGKDCPCFDVESWLETI